MRDRLELLYRLLANGGLLWVHLDDSEVHYCKVLLDEIFIRNNFVANITYERSGAAGLGLGGFIVNTGENILLYKKNELPVRKVFSFQELDERTMKRYNKALIEEGTRELVAEFVSKSNGMPVKLYRHSGFRIETISLNRFQERREEIKAEFARLFSHLFRTNQIQKENEFQRDLVSRMDKQYLYTVDYTPSRGKNEGRLTTLYYHNAELFAWLRDTAQVDDGHIAKASNITNVWTHAEIPKADIANEGGVDFPRGKKPEQLLSRIIDMSTQPGELVLDSFAGSGTTGAVAHKMGRRWIMVELGEHCHTHIIPRIKNLIEGQDPRGITKAVNWKGGGGFRYFRLAPSLLEKDRWGNWVISKEYNATMLASAMAKHEGFVYNPDENLYWKQGKSTEKDYIFTTTNFITVEYLDSIHEEMQPDESLLICCKSFQKACEDRYDNITVRKIPNMLLGRCEFGKEDYSLNIATLPWQPTDKKPDGDSDNPQKTRKKPNRPVSKKQKGLSDEEGD
jgi:adenine-specific DNA-methyltransferase